MVLYVARLHTLSKSTLDVSFKLMELEILLELHTTWSIVTASIPLLKTSLEPFKNKDMVSGRLRMLA